MPLILILVGFGIFLWFLGSYLEIMTTPDEKSVAKFDKEDNKKRPFGLDCNLDDNEKKKAIAEIKKHLEWLKFELQMLIDKYGLKRMRRATLSYYDVKEDPLSKIAWKEYNKLMDLFLKSKHPKMIKINPDNMTYKQYGWHYGELNLSPVVDRNVNKIMRELKLDHNMSRCL